MSYLQLPTRKTTEDNRFCSKCGDPGHWKRYCQATTWCQFCTSETHATQACRRYANFVRDNPIVSSRRMTPKQPEPHRIQPPTAGNEHETIIPSTSNTMFSSTSSSTGRSKRYEISDTMTIPSAEKQPRYQNGSSFLTTTSTVFTSTTALMHASTFGGSERVGTLYSTRHDTVSHEKNATRQRNKV